MADSAPESPNSPGTNAQFGKKVVETKIDAEGKKIKIVKRVKTETVTRAPTMVDLRKKWKHFGFTAEEAKDTVAIEAPILLELGSVDPIEKSARDDVMKLINASMVARVEVNHPGLRKIPALAQQQADADKAAAAAAATGEPEKKTWAQGRDKKTDASGAKKDSTIEKTTVRVLNVADNISDVELRRLFGPANGLGQIKQVFLAKDREGGRRGFAYIKYHTERDAEAAIRKLNKTAFKHVILGVDYGTQRN